tara:strand:+ start:1402 stop:1851 length:450 start_codon:yes stop_codon:yes gene_type:complete
MVKLRDRKDDVFKADKLMNEQKGLKCKLMDCDKDITVMTGPGSNVLCRYHQLKCAEYGGMGKLDRLHTFYREWVCVDCKYDPREDPAFDGIEDEYHKIACMRATLEGDHKELKSGGGDELHTKENIETRCCRCHRIKTMINKDYLGATQ